MIPRTNQETPPRVRLSPPIRLRLKSAPFFGVMLSLREHLPAFPPDAPNLPLTLLTFHPGYLAGSYEDRDYFERLSPLLFQWARGRCRLRIFTINHPGYDLPRGAVIDPFRLGPYSIRHQPLAIEAALSWLLRQRLAREREVAWIAYGHSMGGLALSQFQAAPLNDLMARQNRRLHFARILSAPALFVHPETRAFVGQLDVLHTLKLTVGRFPLYAPIATGLYQAFAPLFYRRDAARFSIDAWAEFGDFSRLDPFVLLKQGRELLRFKAIAAGGADLLAGTHVILPRGDGMIDLPALTALIHEAQQQGHTVTAHEVDSTHLLELDDAATAANVVRHVIRTSWERHPI